MKRRSFGSLVLGALSSLGGLAQAGVSIDPIERAAAAMAPAMAARGMLVAVCRTPGNTWVAVGRRGLVLVSQDCTRWSQAAVPTSVDLTSVCFATATHGWAAGHGGVILATSDGGSTWRKQLDGRQAAALLVKHYEGLAAGSSAGADVTFGLEDAKRFLEDGPGRPFLDIWFADEHSGIAVGAFNLVFTTKDGGRTWLPAPDLLDNPRGLHLYAVRQVGTDRYIAGEQGLLARFDAASGTYRALQVPYNGSFFGVTGTDRLLLVFGLRGNVLRSRDRGVTWERPATGLSGTVACAMVLDDGRLVLASQDGRMAMGPADGAQFAQVKLASPGTIYGIAPGHQDRAVLVGASGVRLETLR